MIDVLILSNAKDVQCMNITLNALISLRNAKNVTPFNIVVIEQQKNITYDGVKTLHYDFKFHYHKCLNYAISKTKNKHIVMCNNDLEFEDYWADKLMIAFGMGYRSLSPYCRRSHKVDSGDHLYEGYIVGVHILGSCIAVERNVIKEIGGLNEDVEFWYSDNIYGEQIKKAKVKHALVCNSFVTHTASSTLNTVANMERRRITGGQKKKYQKALKNLYDA